MGKRSITGRVLRWGLVLLLFIGLVGPTSTSTTVRAATDPKFSPATKAAAEEFVATTILVYLIYCTDQEKDGSHDHIYTILEAEECSNLLTVGLIFRYVIDDPPDPNFNSIAQPSTYSMTPVGTSAEVTPQAAAATNALIPNMLSEFALGQVLYTAMNRASGAFNAGNASAQAAQLQAAQGFAGQLFTLTKALPTLLTNQATALVGSGQNRSYTASDVAAFQSQLRSSGLPSGTATLLSGLGVSSADQASLAQRAAAANPQTAASLGGGHIAQALMDPSFINAIVLAGYDLRLFSLGVDTGIQFYPLAKPVRLIDTRPGSSTCLHPGAPLTGGAPLSLLATGSCTGIPAGALAVVGNGTVIASPATSAGFVTFYPGGAPLPLASNLNYVPGQTAPNAFTVALGSDGTFNAYASSAADLVIDLTGVYGPAGLTVTSDATPAASTGLFYHPLPAPVRLIDTRAGQSGCLHPNTPLAATTPLSLTATGSCTGIPASARSIVGNGTVVADVGGSGPGFVTFFPGGATLPLASNLNYVPGDVRPNAFTVGLGAQGNFNSYALTATDLLIDVTGYYDAVSTGGLLFLPLGAPVRLFDSRAGQGACVAPGTPLVGGRALNLVATTTCTAIPSGARAITGNGTVVAGGSAGFVAFFPGDKSLPLASNLNYVPGQVAPNAFTVGLAGNGSFNSTASSGTDLVIDVTGFFT